MTKELITMRWNTRKLAAALLVLSIISANFMTVFAAQETKINIEGEIAELENPIVFSGGYNFAPMSEIMALLGAEIDWNANTKTITAKREGNEVVVEIGAAKAYVNSEEMAMEPPARIIDGRTYVPVGFIGRALGYDVEWSADSRTVVMKTPVVAGGGLNINYKPKYETDLTIEQAYEKALKGSNELKTLTARLNNAVESFDEINWEYSLAGIPTDYSDNQYSTSLRSALSQIASTENSIENTPLNMEIAKKALDYTIRGSFLSIYAKGIELALGEAKLELDKRTLDNTELKYQLGMVSEVDYEKAKMEYEKAVESQETAKRSLDSEYLTLNKLLGNDADTRYNVVIDEEYVPIIKNFPLDSYITTSVATSPKVRIAENDLKLAESSKNLYTGTSDAGLSQVKTSVEAASRNVEETKKTLEKSIRTAYSGLRDAETGIASEELDLKKAKTDLETARVNYSAGNITELELLQAMYAVEASEKVLEISKSNYNLSKFAFLNPSLLAGA